MSESDDIGDILASLDEDADAVTNREKAFREQFGFDLEALRAIDAPDPSKVLTWGGDWTLNLGSGREIYLASLHQYAVHGGVLAGIPIYIERDLLAAIGRAGKLFGGEDHLVLLEPVLRNLSLPRREKPDRVLPPVCSIAVFNSSTPARDQDEVYSSLTVIWFGDRFGLPDDDDTLKKLRALDWNGRAFDWTP